MNERRRSSSERAVSNSYDDDDMPASLRTTTDDRERRRVPRFLRRSARSSASSSFRRSFVFVVCLLLRSLDRRRSSTACCVLTCTMIGTKYLLLRSCGTARICVVPRPPHTVSISSCARRQTRSSIAQILSLSPLSRPGKESPANPVKRSCVQSRLHPAQQPVRRREHSTPTRISLLQSVPRWPRGPLGTAGSNTRGGGFGETQNAPDFQGLVVTSTTMSTMTTMIITRQHIHFLVFFCSSFASPTYCRRRRQAISDMHHEIRRRAG